MMNYLKVEFQTRHMADRETLYVPFENNFAKLKTSKGWLCAGYSKRDRELTGGFFEEVPTNWIPEMVQFVHPTGQSMFCAVDQLFKHLTWNFGDLVVSISIVSHQ